ncbi:hypothetical protein DFS33DRAFT_1387650 [Desarmillaria ectypa]|nr:hypothetical protein DFS33DRAFT_1387650 [Desarmillaria ectypa]
MASSAYKIRGLARSITRADDLQFLGQLPKLRVYHLEPRLPRVELPWIQVPVVMPHIQYLVIEELRMLELVTLPRLESLVFSNTCFQPRERIDVSACITHFLQRSGCHLKSLNMDEQISAYYSGFSTHKLLASDAFSMLSIFKVELRLSERLAAHIVQSLTPCSDAPLLLPNLYHLALCMDRHISPKTR